MRDCQKLTFDSASHEQEGVGKSLEDKPLETGLCQ